MIPEEAFPLTWPVGWARNKYTRRSPFGHNGRVQNYKARDQLVGELRRLGGRRVVLSTNIPTRQDGLPYANAAEPADHGVAAYFMFNGEPRVLACDKWDQVASNMVAIAKHVEAIRGQARWGCGSLEQALGGYRALAPMQERKKWWDVLGVSAHAATNDVQRARLALLEENHPDHGGWPGRAQEINVAFDEFQRERGLS